MDPSSHIVITGPGRAGTSFLVQLLTRLGFDTGFEPYYEPFREDIRAGCEWAVDTFTETESGELISNENLITHFGLQPYIFKAPDWSFKMKGYLARGVIRLDHVIIPFRDFDEAAKSRLSAGLPWMVDDNITDPMERWGVQAAVHAAMFGRAMEACYLFYLPVTVLRFPLFVKDADYLFARLNPIFDINGLRFMKVFRELADPEMIQTR